MNNDNTTHAQQQQQARTEIAMDNLVIALGRLDDIIGHHIAMTDEEIRDRYDVQYPASFRVGLYEHTIKSTRATLERAIALLRGTP
tara:strand:- start:215 stop:472 length:258 start_codon:yes stop_codon:yes gene_type:complete